MSGTVLASVYANNEGGSYLTFAFPIILFAVIASVLWVLLFSRPHPRVPPRRVAAAHAGPPAPEAARAAAEASGMPTATGGGSAESAAEGPGAHRGAATTDDRGNVSGGTPGDTGQGTTEETEAGE